MTSACYFWTNTKDPHEQFCHFWMLWCVQNTFGIIKNNSWLTFWVEFILSYCIALLSVKTNSELSAYMLSSIICCRCWTWRRSCHRCLLFQCLVSFKIKNTIRHKVNGLCAELQVVWEMLLTVVCVLQPNQRWCCPGVVSAASSVLPAASLTAEPCEPRSSERDQAVPPLASSLILSSTVG